MQILWLLVFGIKVKKKDMCNACYIEALYCEGEIYEHNKYEYGKYKKQSNGYG